MGEFSKIAWTDHSFNGWWICTEVSKEEHGGGGCDQCYAREFAARFGYGWGPGVPRRFFGDKHWNEPRKWNKRAAQTGVKEKVFAFSMADWADNEVAQEHRERFFNLVEETPNLIWQMLTKRIGNAKDMLPERWMKNGLPDNVWFGITVVNQPEADRDIPKLLQIPARIRWLSIEPQLGPVSLKAIPIPGSPLRTTMNVLRRPSVFAPHIHWAVIGGESGNRAREFRYEWALSLIKQCRDAGVAPFMKQAGSNAIGLDNQPVDLKSYKGDDPEEWPGELRVREFPAYYPERA
jgi:protein gp37